MLIDAVASVVVHEMAHLIAAFLLKVKIKKVGITWKGPYLKRESGTPPRNLVITLAGPGINILLAILTRHMYPTFALNNIVLGVFNLLPIPTFDGHRALHAMAAIAGKRTCPRVIDLAGATARNTVTGRCEEEPVENMERTRPEAA